MTEITTFDEARRHMNHLYVRGCMETGSIVPPECDVDLNDASRQVVRAMSAENGGECWLGNINVRQDRALWKCDGPVLNFAADFCIPRYDIEIERLIWSRHYAEYESTTEDRKLVMGIERRLLVVGGCQLHWS